MAIRTVDDVQGLIDAGGIEGELEKVAREDEAHDFMRRQTVAAEESARAAKTAATWAK